MASQILVTGSSGQIGSELVPALQTKFGTENIIAVDIKTLPGFQGISENFDILDSSRLEQCIITHKIDTIYHLVSLLSATGEAHPDLAWQLNMGGLKSVLDLAVKYKLKVFWPSSIAAFGPTTPRTNTPQHTILEPTTMYGVTKVAGELLCQYYFEKYHLDVRGVRYPGIISYKTPPGGGTTDYAVAIFYEGLQTGEYTCFVRENTVLPMMYMDDAVRATLMLMDAPAGKITVRTSYNLAGISFSARELADEIASRIPLKVNYVPDHRQAIADSWPHSIDDSSARTDWGWRPEFDLSRMTAVMLDNLKTKFNL
jgi:nucleoside-diphosphate-sugar epimerase